MLEVVLIAVGFVLCIWASLLLLQVAVAAGVLLRKGGHDSNIDEAEVTYTVLIPAHNEEEVIGNTLRALSDQICDRGRVVVVADNCTDSTAAIVKEYDVELVERTNESLRGKGYALDCGVRHIAAASTDVVVVFDADCVFVTGSLQALVAQASKLGRPVQAFYCMSVRGDEGISERVAHFAWRVKNYLRPLGMRALGMPCQLMGTGMAFPWKLLSDVELASSSLVEDMELGVEFGRLGVHPVFCPQASVYSEFPVAQEAKDTQRARWEHGHLYMIFSRAPKMLVAALMRRDLKQVFLVLDLSVPPLSFLFLMVALYSVVSIIFAILWAGDFGYAVAASICMVCAVAIAWLREGRDLLTPAEIAKVPVYVLQKLPIYLRFFKKRQVTWVRTNRK